MNINRRNTISDELNKQGFLSTDDFLLEMEYADLYVSDKVLRVYYYIVKPIIYLMQRSEKFTKCVYYISKTVWIDRAVRRMARKNCEDDCRIYVLIEYRANVNNDGFMRIEKASPSLRIIKDIQHKLTKRSQKSIFKIVEVQFCEIAGSIIAYKIPNTSTLIAFDEYTGKRTTLEDD